MLLFNSKLFFLILLITQRRQRDMVFHGEQADDADGEEGGNHCNIEAQAQIAECPVNQTAQHTSHRIDLLAEDNRFLNEKHIADDSSEGARDTSHDDSYPEWETTIEGLLDSGNIEKRQTEGIEKKPGVV